ncbi:4-hydroxy-tetrahydrodipicolinate reductase [Sphingomonas sp. FW199]|uniref:4-hydroxy-tetrahydrodipicolinate reductase n=1 Tax=Sphingomonas sp. FW199 TaxID=3400217 RepID=UPI003CF131C4
MTGIGIFGADGRMGLAIAAVAERMGVAIAGRGDAGSDPVAVAAVADVLIDFSVPAALEANLRAAQGAGKPILIGTTGLDEAHHAMIDAAAAEIAVLQTGNTSLGVTLLTDLVRQAAARLGEGWDIEIVEAHHSAKRDAPSGTALMLGEAAAEGRGTTVAAAGVMGRMGMTGAREAGTIGFASVRGGSIPGDHSVIIAGPDEVIELNHRAYDRTIFARGAVRGAVWLTGKAAGRYTMQDVLAR